MVTSAMLTSNKGEQHAILPSSSPSMLPPPELSMASTSAAVDMFANSQHASQLTTAFTKYHATEQAQEEHQWVLNAEHLANIKKTKHQVIIYAWPKVCSSLIVHGFVELTLFQQDNVKAIIFEVQGGFTWPLFTLTAAVLSEAGLLVPGIAEETCVKKYNIPVNAKISV